MLSIGLNLRQIDKQIFETIRISMQYGDCVQLSPPPLQKDGFFRLFSFRWLGRSTGGGVAELSASSEIAIVAAQRR